MSAPIFRALGQALPVVGTRLTESYGKGLGRERLSPPHPERAQILPPSRAHFGPKFGRHSPRGTIFCPQFAFFSFVPMLNYRAREMSGKAFGQEALAEQQPRSEGF